MPAGKQAGRPSEVIPADDQQPAWYLAWAEYHHSLWSQNYCYVSPLGYSNDIGRSMKELQDYGAGSQSTDKYRGILDKKLKAEDGSDAWLTNISWDPPQVLPTIRERIIDRVMEMRFDPSVIAIDDMSMQRKENMYLRDVVAASGPGRDLMQKTGMAPDNVSQNALIMEPDDLAQYKALGGYSLGAEIALTEATLVSLDLCQYFPNTHRQVLGDLFDYGHAHVEVRTNPGDRIQSVQYIDPQMAIVPMSQYEDHRDVTIAGYFRPVSIAKLREESGFDEETICEIAKGYNGYMGNHTYGTLSVRSYPSGRYSGNAEYDKFSVMVQTSYFIAGKAESHIVGMHPSGSRVYDRVKAGAKIKKADSGYRIENDFIQNVYRVDWVVGTKYIYAYGIDNTVVRDGVPGDMKALLPIVTFRAKRKSMTELCISTIDDICMAVYKKRHIIAKMPPAPNVFIDISALERVTQLGSLKLKPNDLLDLYTVRGVMIGSMTADFDDFPNRGSAPSPIIPLPNTTLDQLNAIQADLEISWKALRDITGINEITDGSGNPNNVLNKVAGAFESSTNRALSWLYTANQSIQTDIYKQLAMRYQRVSATGELAIKHIPMSSMTAEVIRLTPDIALSSFHVIVRPGIDAIAKQQLIATVTEYRQSSQIGPEDAMAVLNMLARGEYRKAQFFLARAVDRKNKQAMLMAQQNSQAQAQAQAQAGIAIEQEKAKTLEMEYQYKLRLLDAEYKLKQSLETGKIVTTAEAGMAQTIVNNQAAAQAAA